MGFVTTTPTGSTIDSTSLKAEEVVDNFLEAYASEATPKLLLKRMANGCEVIDGHHHYKFWVTVELPGKPASTWLVQGRLSTLRAVVHDTEIFAFGLELDMLGGIRVALPTGMVKRMPGTSQKLENFLERLAEKINRKEARADLVNRVLVFFTKGSLEKSRE